MDVSGIITRLENLFGAAGTEAVVFAESFITLLIEGGGPVLIDAARAGVTAAESVGGTGEVKFNAAMASVLSTLEAESIPVIINAVRGAIEAAVAELAKTPKPTS